MTHKEIFTLFARTFPTWGFSVIGWWTKGPNAIRVRLPHGEDKGHMDVIFTCLSSDEWKVESMKMAALSKDGI